MPGCSTRMYADDGKRKEEKRENSSKPKLGQFGVWSEHLSSSGKKYYYNKKTEISQWEKPTKWVEYERQKIAERKKQQAYSSSSGRTHSSVNHRVPLTAPSNGASASSLLSRSHSGDQPSHHPHPHHHHHQQQHLQHQSSPTTSRTLSDGAAHRSGWHYGRTKESVGDPQAGVPYGVTSGSNPHNPPSSSSPASRPTGYDNKRLSPLPGGCGWDFTASSLRATSMAKDKQRAVGSRGGLNPHDSFEPSCVDDAGDSRLSSEPSPKRSREDMERDLNRSLDINLKDSPNGFSDDEANCDEARNHGGGNNGSMLGRSTAVVAAASAADFPLNLDRLPQLLVEIAEKHNVDLSHPDAVEQLKVHLTAALAPDIDDAPDELPSPQPSHQPLTASRLKAFTAQMDVEASSSSAPGLDAVSPDSCRAEGSDPEALGTCDAHTDVPGGGGPSSTSMLTSLIKEEPQVDEVVIPKPRRSPTPLPEIYTLSASLLNYFRQDFTSHASGWSAEHFERQARHINSDVFRDCLECAQTSADLKCARSLVRVAEIRATLLEQRVMFMRQQYSQLDNVKLYTTSLSN